MAEKQIMRLVFGENKAEMVISLIKKKKNNSNKNTEQIKASMLQPEAETEKNLPQETKEDVEQPVNTPEEIDPEAEEETEPETKVLEFGTDIKDPEALLAYEAYLNAQSGADVADPAGAEPDALPKEEKISLPESAYEEVELFYTTDPVKNSKRKVILLSSLILAVLFLLGAMWFLFLRPRKKEDEKQTTAQTQVITRPSFVTLPPVTVSPTWGSSFPDQEPTTDDEEDTEAYSIVYKLKEGATEELTKLIEQYYQYTMECDIQKLSKLYYDPRNIPVTEEALKRKSGIIEEYRGLTCYSADGLYADEMILYVYYEILFKGIKTPAPTLIRFYAKQLEDGTWTIYNGTIGEALKAHLDKMTANREVISLMVQVNRAFSQACEKDDNLDRLITLMGSASQPTQGSTDSIPESDEEETTQTIDDTQA